MIEKISAAEAAQLKAKQQEKELLQAIRALTVQPGTDYRPYLDRLLVAVTALREELAIAVQPPAPVTPAEPVTVVVDSAGLQKTLDAMYARIMHELERLQAGTTPKEVEIHFTRNDMGFIQSPIKVKV